MSEKPHKLKLNGLAARRELLVMQIAAQRLQIANNIEVWREPLAFVDRGLKVICYFKRHPILAAGASLSIISMMRASCALKWVQNGWMAWRLLQQLKSKKIN
jgi:hypothetical protein